MSSTTVDHGGASRLTSLHPDILHSHILTRLDGSSLATTSCASTELSTLCSNKDLWREICHSTWPSTSDPRVASAISAFPSGHRSLYSDAFPSLHHLTPTVADRVRSCDIKELISAVDVFYNGKLIHSRVLETETMSVWFATSPFQLEVLEHKETVAIPSQGDNSTAMERIRVSWIIIDPLTNRAINVASRSPVESNRHWMTGELQLRFATVVDDGEGKGGHVQCAVVVTCGEEGNSLHMKEVSLQVEDMEGRVQTGLDSLVILSEAMKGQRRKTNEILEKEIYDKFCITRVETKERLETRERNLDVLCIATGVAIFFASWSLFFSG